MINTPSELPRQAHELSLLDTPRYGEFVMVYILSDETIRQARLLTNDLEDWWEVEDGKGGSYRLDFYDVKLWIEFMSRSNYLNKIAKKKKGEICE